jgi:hypothetical protein
MDPFVVAYSYRSDKQGAAVKGVPMEAFLKPVLTFIVCVFLRPLLLVLMSPLVLILALFGAGTYWENLRYGYGRVMDFADSIREHVE